MITSFGVISISYDLSGDNFVYKIVYEHQNERNEKVRSAINCLPSETSLSSQNEMFGIIAKSLPQTIVYHNKEWILICAIRNNKLESPESVYVEFYLDGHLVSKISGNIKS